MINMAHASKNIKTMVCESFLFHHSNIKCIPILIIDKEVTDLENDFRAHKDEMVPRSLQIGS